MKSFRFKNLLLAASDVFFLYSALALTLLIRYGYQNFSSHLNAHFKAFSLIFVFWLLIFFLFDLYSDKFFRHGPATIQTFALAIAVSAVISIVIFYAFESFFRLTPKTNLLIFSAVFGVSDYLWRAILSYLFISGGWRKQILIIGDSPAAADIDEHLKNNPQIGYNLNIWPKKRLNEKNFLELIDLIKNKKIETVVIDSGVKNNQLNAKFIYRLLPFQIKILSLPDFFEAIFQKVPLIDIKENWFIESVAVSRRFYDFFKRLMDAALAFLLIILFSPLIALIAVLTKIVSPGPVIYKQERMGKNNKPFVLYKFRTMKTGEKGPLWTDENDKRLTKLGKILRYTHMDELPQLYNILKGDISFIGPRPERSELARLYGKLPFYEMRHVIKPGLTGWAQVKYKPSASLEEAYEKFQYDVYYIKNRSLILDLLILLKTIRYVFINH